MSYARWGESDVYVFAHAAGFVDCCGCSFESGLVEPYTNALGMTLDFSLGDAELHSPAEVVAHMRRHVEAGEYVPERLLDESLYPPSDFMPAGDAREAQLAVEAVEEAAAAQRILGALDRGEITAQEMLDYVEKGNNPKLEQLWYQHPLNPHEGNDILDIMASLGMEELESGDSLSDKAEDEGYQLLGEDPEYQADLAARQQGRGKRSAGL